MTLAGVVKEDLACSGSSLPKLWPIGLGRYARHALDIMLGETYQQPQKKYNLRLKLQVTSGKLQAPSDTTCGCVDKFNKDLTCRIMHDTV